MKKSTAAEEKFLLHGMEQNSATGRAQAERFGSSLNLADDLRCCGHAALGPDLEHQQIIHYISKH